jgi:hypothetical protein
MATKKARNAKKTKKATRGLKKAKSLQHTKPLVAFTKEISG